MVGAVVSWPKSLTYQAVAEYCIRMIELVKLLVNLSFWATMKTLIGCFYAWLDGYTTPWYRVHNKPFQGSLLTVKPTSTMEINGKSQEFCCHCQFWRGKIRFAECLKTKNSEGRGDKSLRFCEIKREVNEYDISDAYNITEYSLEHILMFNHSLHN